MKNSIVIILGTLIVIAIITYGYNIITYESPLQYNKFNDESPKNNNVSQYKYEENLNKNSGIKQNLNRTQNAKPAFNIGDRFLYEIPLFFTFLDRISSVGGDIILFNDTTIKCVREYFVFDKIRVDETSYFKIQENTLDCTIGVRNVKGVFKEVFRVGDNKTIYVNAETGELFDGVETGENKNMTEYYISNYWYNPWMLALDDNLKWQEEIPYSENKREIHEFSVEGRENMDERECFEVKERVKICSNNATCETKNRGLYYIDTEKRIMLRYYSWLGDIPVVLENRLIEQTYYKKTDTINISDPGSDYLKEYENMIKLINRIGYCGDGICRLENNETSERCCMDCGCNEGSTCKKAICMRDEGNVSEFFSEEHNFRITLPSGWRGSWRGDKIFFEPASGPLISVEVFWSLLSQNVSHYTYSTSYAISTENKNFMVVYSANTKEDYENNLKLYERIKNSFKRN